MAKTKHLARQQHRNRFLGPLVAGVAVVALLAVLGLGGLSRGGNLSGSSPAGDPAPDVPFLTFTGETVTLSDFQGTPVVLNFYASWCPACIAEMPDFQAVHATLEGVRFIGVAQSDVPPLGSPEAALELRSRTGVSYEVFQDPTGSLFAAFGGISMPTTIFIDADGNVVGRQNGALFAEDLRQKIDELLLGA